MKIAVIHGSMRKGNTYGVTQAALSLLREYADVEITEINITPRLVLHDEQLYSKIIVQIHFYSTLTPADIGARPQMEGFTINTVTGQVYEWGEFPVSPTFTEPVR